MWYEEINFFSIELNNKRHADWWTTLSFQEAKEMIGNHAFVTISSQRNEDYKEEEYNTKAIISIKDYTEQERGRFKHNEEIIEKKLALAKQIRSKKPSYWTRLKINQTDNRYENKDLSWYDRFMGANLDPLLSYHIGDLEKMLRKCK